jgi:hypothetical protein
MLPMLLSWMNNIYSNAVSLMVKVRNGGFSLAAYWMILHVVATWNRFM